MLVSTCSALLFMSKPTKPARVGSGAPKWRLHTIRELLVTVASAERRFTKQDRELKREVEPEPRVLSALSIKGGQTLHRNWPWGQRYSPLVPTQPRFMWSHPCKHKFSRSNTFVYLNCRSSEICTGYLLILFISYDSTVFSHSYAFQKAIPGA